LPGQNGIFRFLIDRPHNEKDKSHDARGIDTVRQGRNVVAAGAPAKPASNWIQGEIRRKLKEAGQEDVGASPIAAERLAGLIAEIESIARSLGARGGAGNDRLGQLESRERVFI
jgi:hypothetical protein